MLKEISLKKVQERNCIILDVPDDTTDDEIMALEEDLLAASFDLLAEDEYTELTIDDDIDDEDDDVSDYTLVRVGGKLVLEGSRSRRVETLVAREAILAVVIDTYEHDGNRKILEALRQEVVDELHDLGAKEVPNA